MATEDGTRKLDQVALAAVSGGLGGAIIQGNEDRNVLMGFGGDDELNGREGRDQLGGGGGDDTLLGGEGADTLVGDGPLFFGSSGHDMLVGGSGDDLIQGGGGDDRIYWMPGDGFDTVHGGSGTDTLVLENPGFTLEELMGRISLDPGSPAPVLRDGYIDLKGVSGQIHFPGEAIAFTGLERLRLSLY